MITTKCPHCNRLVNVTKVSEGEKFGCPHCKGDCIRGKITHKYPVRLRYTESNAGMPGDSLFGAMDKVDGLVGRLIGI